jgi:hypothetical protein
LLALTFLVLLVVGRVLVGGRVNILIEKLIAEGVAHLILLHAVDNASVFVMAISRNIIVQAKSPCLKFLFG